MSQEKLLQLYGLKHHPFAPELRKELCPESDEELAFFAEVEGFGEQIELIHNWFKNAENLVQPARILVYGPEGSGRSSVVNYIAYLFLKAKKFEAEQPSLIIKVLVEDHDALKPVQDVLEKFYYRIREHLKGPLEELNKLYMEHVILSEEPSSEKVYRLIYKDSIPILEGKGYVPIIILDKVLDYAQISTSDKVFEDTPIVLYTTSTEKIYKDAKESIKQHALNGLVVELGNLKLQDIKNFLKQRWLTFSEGTCHPFDEDGINNIFEDEDLPFQTVIDILAEAFQYHWEDLENQPSMIGDLNQNPKLFSIPENKIWKAACRYYKNRKKSFEVTS